MTTMYSGVSKVNTSIVFFVVRSHVDVHKPYLENHMPYLEKFDILCLHPVSTDLCLLSWLQLPKPLLGVKS